MLEITGVHHPKLNISNWKIAQADSWSVLVKNGNEQTLLELFQGNLSGPSNIELNSTSVISFKTLQEIFEYELKIDQTDITDEVDFGTTVKEYLPKEQLNNELIDLFNMRHRMDTGFRLLSTGKSRKLQILKCILEGNKLLILENPFDSLDAESCNHLSEILGSLSFKNISIVMLINNKVDIPYWCNNFAAIKGNALVVLKNDETLQSNIDDFFSRKERNIE